MESRLDSQRRHMVQKESQLKNEVEELKVKEITRITPPTSVRAQDWSQFAHHFLGPRLRFVAIFFQVLSHLRLSGQNF